MSLLIRKWLWPDTLGAKSQPGDLVMTCPLTIQVSSEQLLIPNTNNSVKCYCNLRGMWHTWFTQNRHSPNVMALPLRCSCKRAEYQKVFQTLDHGHRPGTRWSLCWPDLYISLTLSVSCVWIVAVPSLLVLSRHLPLPSVCSRKSSEYMTRSFWKKSIQQN